MRFTTKRHKQMRHCLDLSLLTTPINSSGTSIFDSKAVLGLFEAPDHGNGYIGLAFGESLQGTARSPCLDGSLDTRRCGSPRSS